MRLLLAEDDRMLGESLVRGLSRSGYAVDWIRDGIGARDALGLASYDLVVLDLGLPGVDGIRVLQEFRSGGSITPLLILTARDAPADRVRGLDAGADDYLVKPFNLDELLARLRALSRRSAGHPAPVFQHLGVQLDPATREVCVAGQAVALTRREFSLLEALLERPTRVWTRERLIDRIYGFGDGIASNALEVHIHALRRKIAADFIVSVRGVGYTLQSA